jgi:hypothetical protein
VSGPRRALFVVGVLLAMAGVACGGGGGSGATTPPSTGQLKTYVNSERGFSIAYPEGWTPVQGAGRAIVGFASPKEGTADQFQENVTVSSEDLPSSSISIDQYTAAALGQVQKVITGFHLESSEDATVAGKPGHRIVYTGTQERFQLRWQQAFTIVGDSVWILTFVAEEDSYDRYVATARSMFDSFTLT